MAALSPFKSALYHFITSVGTRFKGRLVNTEHLAFEDEDILQTFGDVQKHCPLWNNTKDHLFVSSPQIFKKERLTAFTLGF